MTGYGKGCFFLLYVYLLMYGIMYLGRVIWRFGAHAWLCLKWKQHDSEFSPRE